jgi:hypothetical protein
MLDCDWSSDVCSSDLSYNGQSSQDVRVGFMPDVKTNLPGILPTPADGTEVATLAPVIGIVDGTSPNGINGNSFYFTVNGSTRPLMQDWMTGLTYWTGNPAYDGDNYPGLPPILANNTTYTTVVDFADWVCYKTSASWSVTTRVPASDPTPPVILDLSPAEGADITDYYSGITMRLVDDESGIDYRTIEVLLDGQPMILPGELGMNQYRAGTGELGVYFSADTVAAGSHSVTVRVSHFATSPADPASTTTEVHRNFTFNPPPP